MKLSRNTLRSLAVGVLASAVVTAAFALSQGHLPVQGVNGTNVLMPYQAKSQLWNQPKTP